MPTARDSRFVTQVVFAQGNLLHSRDCVWHFSPSTSASNAPLERVADAEIIRLLAAEKASAVTAPSSPSPSPSKHAPANASAPSTPMSPTSRGERLSSERGEESPEGEESKELIDRYGMVHKGLIERTNSDLDRMKRERSIARERKWVVMDKDWKSWSAKHAAKVKQRVRKGIPDSLRGKFWRIFSAASGQLTREDHAGLYERLKQQSATAATETQIRKDITRTFPHHVMFKSYDVKHRTGNGKADNNDEYNEGQISMFNVLKSTAVHLPDVGYCQGMSGLCATFLMYMNEEEAFWMMDRLLLSEKYWELKDMFKEGLVMVRTILSIHGQLLKQLYPRIYGKTQEFADNPYMCSHDYASAWYIGLFGGDGFDRELTLRIWDVFFYEGVKVLFRVGLAVMSLAEQEIAKADEVEFMTILKQLPSSISLDPDAFMMKALAIPITEKQILALRKKA